MESPCFDVDHLQALFHGGSPDFRDPVRALEHFAGGCGPCWRNLADIAEDRSVDFDLDSMSLHAGESVDRLPVALVLARSVALMRDERTSAALRPMHRDLLHNVRRGTRFHFWWLLIEEIRHLALQTPPRRVERWTPAATVLGRYSGGSVELDRELDLLMRAYRADDVRVAGGKEATRKAGRQLTEVLDQVDSCRAALRATIFEVRADYHRSLREPRQALIYLKAAEELWREQVRVPGRLAETRTRVALAHLMLKDVERALATFREALELIPEDTNPRLRLDILFHLAAVTIRRGDFDAGRLYLSEMDRFFEPHASELMGAQRHWLRGLVDLDAGALSAAEARLSKALAGFRKLDTRHPVAQAQVLLGLSQLCVAKKDAAGLHRNMTELVHALEEPEVRVALVYDVARVVRQARESGLTIPVLDQLPT